MMADLCGWAMAYPVIAGILGVIVLLMVVLLAIAVIGLRQLAPDALSDISEIHSLEPRHQAKHSPSRPLPWTRSGGNWWPVP